MIEKQARIEKARWVEGDLGVHFVYTAGVAGEEFLRGLQKGKLLASACDRCKTTYCPPRLFCERCFAEVSDRREVAPTGTVEAATRVHVDAAGGPRRPEWVAAVRIDGTDSTLVHRVAADAVAVGDRVEGVWASKRTGSILDLQHFRLAGAPKPPAKAGLRAPQANGGKRPVRRAAAR